MKIKNKFYLLIDCCALLFVDSVTNLLLLGFLDSVALAFLDGVTDLFLLGFLDSITLTLLNCGALLLIHC